MKALIIAMLCLAIGLGGGYLLFGVESQETFAPPGEAEQLYTCGMHPEIVSNEPGVCPICNMNLTPKKEGSAAGSIVVDPSTRQNMGVVTAPARRRPMARTIRLFSELAVPEPNITSVNARVGGWIEALHVAATGTEVSAGQPLFELYSPELVAAQEEYLITRRATRTGDSILTNVVRTAETRLANWGITKDQIAALQRFGEIRNSMTIHAPTDGFVLAASIDAGQKVAAGQELYRLGDFSTLWLVGYVYEADAPWLSTGLTAVVTVPDLPDAYFGARVSYVAPFLDERRRLELRIELDNPDLVLRPGMYAEASVEAWIQGHRLAVPRKAVINSGKRRFVYLTDGDTGFRARQVTTGLVDDDDFIEITDGLAAGEMVVISGQFLLDSEARLSEALDDGSSTPPAGEHAEASVKSSDDDPYNIHTCPMPEHYHVLSYGPGQCDECGMALVPVRETDNEDVFVCPMPECGIARNNPGQCPVCNMSLVRYQPGGGHD